MRLGFVPILEIEFMAKTHTYREEQLLLPRQFTHLVYGKLFNLDHYTIPSNPPKKTPPEPRNFRHQPWTYIQVYLRASALRISYLATIFYAKSSKQFLKIKMPNGHGAGNCRELGKLKGLMELKIQRTKSRPGTKDQCRWRSHREIISFQFIFPFPLFSLGSYQCCCFGP